MKHKCERCGYEAPAEQFNATLDGDGCPACEGEVPVAFTEATKPKVGDIWRKDGPCDWIKIVGIQWRGYPGYDGALQGISVVFTNGRGNWGRKQWFVPVLEKDFQTYTKDTYRYKKEE